MTSCPDPPPWRSIGELDRLLRPDALASHLRGAGLDVLAAEPDFIRLKPGSGALVGVRLELRDDEGGVVRLPGYVRTHESGRAAQLARKWHAGRAVPTAVGRGVRLLPGGRSVLFLFPNDAEVRGMRFVADVDKLKRGLAELEPLSEGCFRVMGRRSAMEVVRYKPERRLILRAGLRFKDDAGGGRHKRRVFLRFFTDRRGQRLHRLATALRGGAVGARVPEPCGTLFGGRLQVEEDVGGQPLLPRLRAGTADPRAVAELLVRLHGAGVEGLPELDVAGVLLRAGRVARDLTRVAPELERRIDGLIARLRAVAPPDGPRSTLHGDCHLDQFRVDATGPLLVDFERAARGHPLVDLGQLCAHAAVVGRRDPAVSGMAAAFEGELVEHALGAGTGGCARDLPFFVVAGLLERALLPFRRLEPDWRRQCAEVLDLACGRLDPGGTPAPRRPRFFAGEDFGEFHPRRAAPWPGRVTDPRGRVRHGTYHPGEDRFRELDPARDTALPALGEWARGGELLAYRAGQRATLRTRDGTDVVKVVRPRKTGVVAARYRALAALRAAHGAPFPRVPAVRRVDGRRGLIVLERLPGEAFDACPAGDPPRGEDLAKVASGLAALHRGHGGDAGLGLRPAPRSAEAWIGIVARHDPGLARRAEAALHHIEAVGPRYGRDVPVHGDLHDRNILVTAGGIALVDLDQAGLGDPAEDLGNLAAHLVLRALQCGRSVVEGWRNADRLVAAYAAAGGEAGAGRTTAAVARTLLRLGCVYRFRHRWKALCGPLLEQVPRARERLTGAGGA